MLIEVLVHAGYTMMLCALLARDMLWLRSLLVVAQSTLSVYAFAHDVPAIGAWNVVFVVINTIWVIRILRERRAVQLPADLVELHARHFLALTPQEFLRFWAMGQHQVLDQAALTVSQQNPKALYFMLAGEVSVTAGGRELARLHRGSFVGEMSLLTGDVATADTVAQGRIEVQAWPMAVLQALRARNPQLWTRVQSALGHDIVEKIQTAARQAPQPADALP
jgi:CRP-like cAMP-binding protein